MQSEKNVLINHTIFHKRKENLFDCQRGRVKRTKNWLQKFKLSLKKVCFRLFLHFTWQNRALTTDFQIILIWFYFCFNYLIDFEGETFFREHLMYCVCGCDKRVHYLNKNLFFAIWFTYYVKQQYCFIYKREREWIKR